MSECVSEQASKRVSAAERASESSKRCEQTSEWKSEWPSTYVWNLGYFGPWWISRRNWNRQVAAAAAAADAAEATVFADEELTSLLPCKERGSREQKNIWTLFR